MTEPTNIADYFQLKYGVDITDTEIVNDEKNDILVGLAPDSYSAALYNGDHMALEAFLFLLSRGADPNSLDPSSHPILSNVVQYGSVQAIEALLKAGAKIDLEDESGKYVLMN
jgi:ankyrin repeat protein